MTDNAKGEMCHLHTHLSTPFSDSSHIYLCATPFPNYLGRSFPCNAMYICAPAQASACPSDLELPDFGNLPPGPGSSGARPLELIKSTTVNPNERPPAGSSTLKIIVRAGIYIYGKTSICTDEKKTLNGWACRIVPYVPTFVMPIPTYLIYTKVHHDAAESPLICQYCAEFGL